MKIDESRQNSHVFDDETIDIREIFRMLRRRKWTIVLFVIFCVIPTSIYSYKRPETFRATARFLFEKETPDVVSFKEVVQTDLGDKDEYGSQVEILKSYPVAEQVVEQLRLDAATLEKTSFSPAKYFLGAISSLKTWMGQPDEIIASEESAAILLKERAVGMLLGRINISPVRGTRLLDVSADSTDPQQAAQIANALVQAYMKQMLEGKVSASKEAVSWLIKEVEDAKQNVLNSEAALQQYKEEQGILSLQDRQNIVMQKLSELNSSLHKARVQRMEAETQYNQVKGKKGDELQTLPKILDDPMIQQLKVRVSLLETDLLEILQKLREKHPDVEAMRSRIGGVNAQIELETQRIVKGIKTQYDIALEEEQQLLEALESQKIEVQALNEKSIEYNVLERDVESNRHIYNTLLQRMKEASLTERLKTSNVRIVEQAAVPKRPIAPKKTRNILLAAILGAMLGVSFAWFAESADMRLRTLEDVRRYLEIPALGFIPKVSVRQIIREKNEDVDDVIVGLVTLMEPKSNIAEAYRSLRTHVLFSALGKQAIILVTSSMPGEGKSSMASNLAISFAQSGRKTVLVDCDFRRPMLAKIFHTDVVISGFADLLVQNEMEELWNIIHSTDVPNLDVIPCGTIPPNPAELLSQEKTSKLLNKLKERYDMIILDSPPINAVADPVILSDMADGIVFVMKAGTMTVDAARHALHELRGRRENIWGGVLNMVDLKKEGYYYYSYKESSYYTSEHARQELRGKMPPKKEENS